MEVNNKRKNLQFVFVSFLWLSLNVNYFCLCITNKIKGLGGNGGLNSYYGYNNDGYSGGGNLNYGYYDSNLFVNRNVRPQYYPSGYRGYN